VTGKGERRRENGKENRERGEIRKVKGKDQGKGKGVKENKERRERGKGG
jgi:hypothetical protein